VSARLVERFFCIGVALLTLGVSASCAHRSSSACSTLTQSLHPTPGAIAASADVLSSTARTAQFRDVCAIDAALGVTLDWQLMENSRFLREIVTIPLARVVDEERSMAEETIAKALQTLSLLDDPDTTSLARRHIDSPASIAGTAMMTLRDASDWTSTDLIARRLAGDTDPWRHYSLMSIGLEFLVASPIQPSRRCELLDHLSVFDVERATRRKDPNVAHIVDMREQLRGRYECVTP